MKKLIAISVVFALAAGVAFAVDLAGEVIGLVNVIEAKSDGDVTGSAAFKRLRLEGGGEVADGQFGGWLRFEGGSASWALKNDPTTGKPYTDKTDASHYAISWSDGIHGIAWWKPIDQLKLSIGGNPDGIWGKEGNSGWAFTHRVSDTGVNDDGHNVYGDPSWAPTNVGLKTRMAFYEGFGDNRLFIEITPVDMVSINIGIPFFAGGDIGDVFKGTHAQVALNLSFGEIAFSYAGKADIKESQIFAYFGLTAIDNLRIDFGLGTDFQSTPLNFGLAVAYGQDTWGIRFRTMFGIPVNSGQPFGMLFDVLPYFVVNENFRVFISGGFAFEDAKDFANSRIAWHINPYIEIGEEWGPQFLAGIKVYQRLNDGGKNSVNFAIPIAIIVSF